MKCKGTRPGRSRLDNPSTRMSSSCVDPPSAITECYTPPAMYAQKLSAEMEIAGQRRPVPLDWLDSFCMRNFTGSGEFDDTLSTGEGTLEAGLNVDPARLAAAMSEWFTKRGKGDGQPVKVVIGAAK